MKIAAEILRGKQVHPKVRTIVIPATQQIYLDCIRLGYVEDIVKAGAIFSTPTCGPCPWRAHGDSGSRRTLRIHNEQKLCRQNGSYRK